MNCGVCALESAPFARARILGRHDVQYFRCAACGFVQTEKPYWLAEAYSAAIARTDVGLVRRNVEQSKLLRALIPLIAEPPGRFLDYGGGYGMLVRLMRDAGFDFRWEDAHCENLFAQDFAAGPDDRFEMVTAFEVLEHLEDPRAGLADMLRRSDSVLLGTYLLPEPCPLPADWWYYGLDQGQHIGLHTRRSLERLAAGAGARLYSNGINLHLLSRRPVAGWRFRLATHKLAAALLRTFFARPSLLQDDFSHSIRQSTRETSKP